jgi:hypothetical protein
MNAQEQIGDMIHAFEKAGLGKAPFTLTGFSHKVGPIRTQIGPGIWSEVGYPGQPMGTCDYCGTGIAMCFHIRSSDGKSFIVGSDCVAKVGDVGLKRMIKSSEGYRKHMREIREKRGSVNRDLLREIVKAHGDRLATMPHPYKYMADQGRTFLSYLEWMIPNAGMKGCSDAIALLRLKAPDMLPEKMRKIRRGRAPNFVGTQHATID